MFSREDGIDYRNNPCLGADCSERTAMNAFSAADAFLIVDYRDAVFIVGNCIYRTTELARPFQVGDCVVWTGVGALAALFTFCRVNMRSETPRLDCAKFTSVNTCFSNTVLAVLCNCITGNRTVLAGRADDLDDITVVGHSRSLALRQADTLPDDLSFLINTAAELRCRSPELRV